MLKRGTDFRIATQDDMKWLWAAYRKGAMTEWLKDGLTPEQFRVTFALIFGKATYVWLLLAAVPERGTIPVGACMGVMTAHNIVEPYALWFPWATKRNIFECAANFIARMRGAQPLMIMSRQKTTAFFTQLGRLGLLRRVGQLRHVDKEPITLFESTDII